MMELVASYDTVQVDPDLQRELLRKDLENLAKARSVEDANRMASLNKAKAELEATPQWEAYQRELEIAKGLKAETEMAYNQVQDDALKLYAATGDKRPLKGVVLKEYTAALYSIADLTEWALTHAPCLLQLNLAVVDKVGLQLPGAPITTSTTVKATVARDLSEYAD